MTIWKATSILFATGIAAIACGSSGGSEGPPDMTEPGAGAGGEGGESGAESANAGAGGAATEVPSAGDGGTSLGGNATNSTPNSPPKPASTTAACIISADCPEGTHCDLGECIQDCNSKVKCKKGFSCSARARCIKADEPDADPPPVTEQIGIISADPLSKELGEQDSTFDVHIASTAKGDVDYRVELRAPFLRLDGDTRGTFNGETTLSFRVDGSNLKGTLTPGSIIIHSTLGDVVVNPSIRVGLSGTYQGVMRYSSGGTAFGDVGIALDMLDKNGDVTVQVEPEHSMTFPATPSGAPAGGRGVFTLSEGLSVSLTQRIEADYGGSRNHFQRPLGRRVSFKLKPKDAGRLEGTFQETIYGILAEPIVLQGTAYLEPRETKPRMFMSVPDAVLPTDSGSEFASAHVFPGFYDKRGCFGQCANGSGCLRACDAGDLGCITGSFESTYYGPLNNSLRQERDNSDPLDDIANACETDLNSGTVSSCALPGALGCALRAVAGVGWEPSDLSNAQSTYNRLFARMLAPALLVAQNHIVQGLKASFDNGIPAEVDRFRKARAALDGPLTFALASGALQYLKDLPVKIAAGDPRSEDPTATNYPAGRALARALYVLHTVDGEQARLDAQDVARTPAEKVAEAQSRGVLGLLEAVALASVVNSWGNPTNLGSEFVGSLTLSDQGFQALQQGALVFGVPEGEVPLVFDPGRALPTNFEQVRALADAAIDNAKAAEGEFRTANRAFEQGAASLDEELGRLRTDLDNRISDICGSDFKLAEVKAETDWEKCGAGGLGEVGAQSLNIELALARLQSARTRIGGMYQKMAIDQKRLADTQGVREAALEFINEVGEQKNVLTVAEGYINVVEKTMEMAANASVFNGGAPLGMAVVTGMLEAERTALNVARNDLETAQQYHAAEDEKKIELINGMAEIQKQLVDIAELRVDMNQDVIGVTQADLARRNLVENAKRLFRERARAIERIGKNPAYDPVYRVLESRSALKAVAARAEAQGWLYRIGRALEYELNLPLGDAVGRAVLGAYNAEEAASLRNCFTNLFGNYTVDFGIPQDFTTTISVRRMLDITGPRTDEVTGEELSEGELFRRAVLRNENLDARGNLTITFSTNLTPGNKLWASDLCNDKVKSIQAELVGDFQGDNEAQINLEFEGADLLRACDSQEIRSWNIGGGVSVAIATGVNTFGDVKANTFYFGQSVARASWKIVIPAPSEAPANADLNLEHIDDIVLKIAHSALPRRNRSVPIRTACLGSIGAGG